MRKKIFARVAAAIAIAGGMASCTTAYDAYGRPVQVVDPAAAAVGALAIGAAAYAIGQNNGDHHDHGHGGHGHHDHGHGGHGHH